MNPSTKTYTVLLSYFDGDENYTHLFLDVFLDHRKALKYATYAVGSFGAKGLVEYNDLDLDADIGYGNSFSSSVVHVVTKTH